MNRTPRLRRSLVIVILGAVLAACSGSGPGGSASPDVEGGGGLPDDPVALIRDVTTHVEDAGSFRMTFDMRIEAAGQAITATGDGEFFQDPPAMHAVYRFGELPGLPSGAEMEMTLQGSTLYLRMPALDAQASFPTEWVSMDIHEIAPGFDQLASLAQGQNDPASSLAYLDGVTDAEVVGTETVAGVETTHYRGSIDPGTAFRRLSRDATSSERSATVQARKIIGNRPMPVDIWIDADGLLRRMAFSMKGSAGGADGFGMAMTMEIPEYGIEGSVTVPPDDEVTDLTSVVPDGDGWSTGG